MKLLDLKQDYAEHARAADGIFLDALAAKRSYTPQEQKDYDNHMSKAAAITTQIKAIEGRPGSLHAAVGGDFTKLISGGSTTRVSGGPAIRGQVQMTGEYNEAFLAFLRSGGKQASSALSEGFDPLFGGFALPAMQGMSAALYEGTGGSSTTAGGYTMSVPTDSQIVPLAVSDLGVRAVSRAIPTATDIKIPGQNSFATAGIKLESGASANLFSESDPALSQFTLSAFMLGLINTVSWELLQDVPMFQEFCIGDLINAVNINEDNFFVNGSGSGQPQGLIGNVGTGTGATYAVEGTGAYLLDSTIDAVGTLKGAYYAHAGWLMSRATATAIRRAQIQANLFAPVWTREGGRDFLHGFPVTYSQAMPAIPTATTAGVTPIFFGSFQDGYLIGDRGGAGTFVKILDQPLATQGQTVLMGYKRVDGRVRRSEAIQSVTISHA